MLVAEFPFTNAVTTPSSSSSTWMDSMAAGSLHRDVLLQMDDSRLAVGGSSIDADTSSSGSSSSDSSPISTRSSLSASAEWLMAHAPRRRSFYANTAGSGSGSGSGSMYQQNSFWDSSAYWLILYFFFNLSLTLYNKIALVSFPFPWTLTCIHSLCASIGSYFCYRRGYFKRAVMINKRDHVTLLLYSSLYTINIAVSNLSLNLVSVPTHQVVRSTTPLFTILISIVLYKKTYLKEIYLSLIPVIMGVCLATYGDYSFTYWGLFLTLFGAFLAAVKGIATNRILVGTLKFHPLDLLLRMSPLAFAQCVVFALLSGEVGHIYERTFVTGILTGRQWFSLLMNGGLAFGLNVVSFTANKKAGALTMSVAANVKQVLTIVLAVMIFHLVINGVNLIGIASTIAGGAWYSYIEYQSKVKSAPRVGASLSSQPMLPTHSASSVLSEKDSSSFVPSAYSEKQQQQQQQHQRQPTATTTPKKGLYDAVAMGQPPRQADHSRRGASSPQEERLHRRTTSAAGGPTFSTVPVAGYHRVSPSHA